MSPDDVRRLALSLPGASESDHFNAPSFRANKRIFAAPREADRVTIKLAPEDQHNLAEVVPKSLLTKMDTANAPEVTPDPTR